ncbi:LppU/SCO3897 family protein [Streptacidiphilus albus]|uniref:LppU/SCO3897 family protein n=1 Tax=Streptacidiphilus albus TaxID=105425 RepID=UPI00069218CB|nr:hypothetical protein [Streptacidiphilus albus]
MSTPPQPIPGNPYAQQPAADNPYGAQVPPQGNPYAPPADARASQADPFAKAPADAPPQFQQPPAFPQPPAFQQPQQFQQPQAFQPPQPGFEPPQQFQQPQPFQQPQYPVQAPFAEPQFQGGPAAPPSDGVSCRFCGAYPAVETTVRAHRGMIFVMQWRSLRGPFCRTCGIATVRRLSADTLWQGWWGYISSVMAPVTLIRNFFAYQKIKALPEPVPGQPGQQMIPGRPLLARPAALGFLIPILVVAVIIAALSSGGSSDEGTDSNLPTGVNTATSAPSSIPDQGTVAKVGDCVKNDGTSDQPDLGIIPCASGAYVVVSKLTGTTADSGCPSTTVESYSDSLDDFVLCLGTYKAS